MNRRMSPGRRILLITTVVIGLLAWALGIIGWTAFGRASGDQGFVDITIETIQSPAGLSTSSRAIAEQVDIAARTTGSSISAAGNAALTTRVQQVLANPDLGNLMGSAITTARQAFVDNPNAGITIDAGALRDQIVSGLSATNPQLATQIPLAKDLRITVSPDQVPPAVSSAANILGPMKWLPIWCLIATTVFLGIGFLMTDNRGRTARRVGIALISLGILPIAMRVITPLVIGNAVSDGSSTIAEVATTATIANWWLALVLTIVVGAVLLITGFALRAPARFQSGSSMLGR